MDFHKLATIIDQSCAANSPRTTNTSQLGLIFRFLFIKLNRRLIVAESVDRGGQFLGTGRNDSLGLGRKATQLVLAEVVDTVLGLALVLQVADHVQVVPADLVGQTADGAELAVRAQAQDAHGQWHAHSLLLGIFWGHSLHHLQTLQGHLAALRLVRHHSCKGRNIRWELEGDIKEQMMDR